MKRITKVLPTILTVIIAQYAFGQQFIDLDLYGLSSYSAERRKNEVGIRKVMGANSITVMYTLDKELLVLVLISIIIAIPMGWIIVENLLKQFTIRIEMSMFVYAGIAIGAIIIAMLTVSFQAIKVATANPVERLRYE